MPADYKFPPHRVWLREAVRHLPCQLKISSPITIHFTNKKQSHIFQVPGKKPFSMQKKALNIYLPEHEAQKRKFKFAFPADCIKFDDFAVF